MTTPLDYANQSAELASDRALRQVIAVAAMVYGGVAVAGAVAHFALAVEWARAPRNMSWGFGDGWAQATMTLTLLAKVTAFIGGLLLLQRRAIALWLIRGAAISICIFALAGTVLLLARTPEYRALWSTPAAAVVQATSQLGHLWLPLLLGVLTHPRVTPRLL